MISHLQEAVDAAMAEQIFPLGEVIARTVGGLDYEQQRTVEHALEQAVVVGLRVALVEATAQVTEQLAGKQVRCDGCGHLTPFEFDVNLVTALAIELPPPE